MSDGVSAPPLRWDPFEEVAGVEDASSAAREVLVCCIRGLEPLIEGYGIFDEERFLEELDDAERVRRRCVKEARDVKSFDEVIAPRIVAAVMILTDLVSSGWVVTWDASEGEAVIERRDAPPADVDSHSAARKRFKKNQLIAARTAQLRAPAAQRFFAEMERPRAGSAGALPVTALFRDGDELADELEEGGELLEHISPYVQVIEEGAVCEHTGLKLTDIFRYFRATWAGPYNKPPGRNLSVLVRDAAAPNHPVIGLLALSNAPLWHGARDQHIGWESEGFIAEMCSSDPAGLDAWLEEVTTAALSRLYLNDLVEAGALTEDELSAPHDGLFERLQEVAEEAKSARAEAAPGRADEALDDDEACERWARRPLFRAKRAEELVKLLRARLTLRSGALASDEPLRSAVCSVLDAAQADVEELSDGDRARAAEWIKRAKHVVSAARDIYGGGLGELSTCGAVAPYSALIGGKLIAMLAASPAVLDAFAARYADTANNIASKKAGRVIKSGGRLVYLTTSSLYDTRPTMYDRVSLSAAVGETRRYKFLQYSKGEGGFHLSAETHTAVKEAAGEKGKRVTSEFGEGTSARMRSLRDCLAELGLPSGEILTHGQRRAAYGVALRAAPRDQLLNLAPDDAAESAGGDHGAATAAVVEEWAERWVRTRLADEAKRAKLIEGLRRHDHCLPLTHGAKVRAPRADLEQPLFDFAE